MSGKLNDEKLNNVNAGLMIDGVEYCHVKAGDTLSEIAERYHVKMSDIMRANNIINPDFIKAGSLLVIPRNN